MRLVDGAEMARVVIQRGVGTVTGSTCELRKLDENYFSEFADL